jgi:glutamate carboxypeptidase
MRKVFTTVALVTISAAIAEAQGLSAAERRMMTSVDAGHAAGITLLERLVNINSGTHNFAGVKAVADALAPEFTKLGFTTRWSEGASWNRAGHLIAEWKGNGTGRKLLLIGHLDTVFERDSPFQKFERVGTDSARGPGIADMKGGNVVMLLALKALKDAGVLDQLQITAVFTGDEEDSGRPIERARGDLTSAADWADIALGFENGPEAPHVAVIARRGSTTWWLRTSGTPSHSSQVFHPRRLSRLTFERSAAHVQPGRDCRWHYGDIRRGPESGDCVWQDERGSGKRVCRG